MKRRKTHNTICSNYCDSIDMIAEDIQNDEWEKEQWIERMGYEDEDYTESDIDSIWEDYCYERACWLANEYIDDERCNLRVNVGNTIIAVGDLGLWDGRVSGYQEIKSGLISDLLYTDCYYAEWYCDAHDMRCKETHHDGTNYILYRRRKDGISDYQWGNFLYMIYEGKATREHISKYTTSLLPYIAKVYGWKYHGKDVA